MKCTLTRPLLASLFPGLPAGAPREPCLCLCEDQGGWESVYSSGKASIDSGVLENVTTVHVGGEA